jgi:hypothetical protein
LELNFKAKRVRLGGSRSGGGRFSWSSQKSTCVQVGSYGDNGAGGNLLFDGDSQTEFSVIRDRGVNNGEFSLDNGFLVNLQTM